MSDVANQDGRTVLYVSHNMSTIRQLCTRCVVLDKGKVIFDGDVEQAIAVYMDTTDVNVVHYELADVARMTGGAGKRFRLETARSRASLPTPRRCASKSRGACRSRSRASI